MPVSRPNGSKYLSFAEGVDNTSSADSPITKGTLSKAENVDLVDDSLLKKRSGYIKAHVTNWGARRIRGGIEYTGLSGETKTLVYGENTTALGNTGVFAELSTTLAPIHLRTDLQDDIKPTLLQYRNLLFVFNGKDDFIYDGNNTRQIGIDFPTVAPVFSSLTTGDLNTSGSYLVVYTYVNTTSGAESSPSPVSEAIDTQSSSGFRITVTPGNAATADKIRVYRTVAGGNIFFIDGDADIAATEYTCSVSDAGLGTELELDNERLPGKVKFAASVDNRIFAAGFADNPNRVHYSKIGISGPMPESFQASDFTDCNLNDGDKIIGLGTVNNTIIVLKQRAVGRLIRVDAQFGGLERGGSQKYFYEEISSQITGLSHHTLCTVDNLCLWLGRDDIYGTDGIRILRFGQRIRNTLRTLNYGKAYKFSSLNKSDTQQIIFSVCRSGETEPDFQLVGHYRYLQETGRLAFTFYAPGRIPADLPGLPAACMFAATTNSVKSYFFGSSVPVYGTGDFSVAWVYRFDTGNSDDSKAISFDVRLPWESAGISAARKLFHSYYLFAASTKASAEIVHTFEEDQSEIITETATTDMVSEAAAWNAENWTNFRWAVIRFLPLVFNPHVRAYWGRYGIQNFNVNEPIAVKGISGLVITDPIHR